jgi:hypothetical protein
MPGHDDSSSRFARVSLERPQRVEPHGGAADADTVAETRGESISSQHLQGFAKGRHVSKLRIELVHPEQARMSLEEHAEDSALGGIRLGHDRSISEQVFVSQGRVPRPKGSRRIGLLERCTARAGSGEHPVDDLP